MDECPPYRYSSGRTAGDDTWSATDDNDAYEKMLKHSQAASTSCSALHDVLAALVTAQSQ